MVLLSVNEIVSVCGLDQGERIVVGVSGGPDSLALTNILIQAGFEVIVTHLNHGIRSEADQEARFVEAFARNHRSEFRIREVDTPGYARQNRQSLEESARDLRYEFLFKTAEEAGAAAVVVGHTADDQVETILMHFLRSAGAAGLGGMAVRSLTRWSDSIPLLRPLLNTWRREIVEYCEESGLYPIYDASNLDKTYRRNKIRHELIPYLEEYNPNLREVIHRTGEVLRGDLAVLNRILEEVSNEVILEADANYVALDLEKFLVLEVGLQRRILRKAIGLLLPDVRDLGFVLIQRVIDEVESLPRGKKFDLFQGLCFRIEATSLYVERWEYSPEKPDFPQLEVDRVEIEKEGEYSIGNGWGIIVEQVPVDSDLMKTIKGNDDRFLAYLNLLECSFPFALRVRLPGDRFRPDGMGGHSQKISDFMINKGVPRLLRGRWPILESGEEVVWVPGYQVSNDVRVETKSGEVLKFQILKTK